MFKLKEVQTSASSGTAVSNAPHTRFCQLVAENYRRQKKNVHLTNKGKALAFVDADVDDFVGVFIEHFVGSKLNKY